MPALLQALRPHQWVKNFVVFAPVVFAHRYGDPGCLGAAALAFLTFCLVASSIYLVNDIVDRESDRLHERKRHRPIASGRVSVGAAWLMAAVLITVASVIALRMPSPDGELPFATWPALYLAMNLGYSFRLKRIVIVDALCIALGFQFRIQAGATAVGVDASKWLVLCTFFFATFLAFCKRREECASHGGGGSTRAVLRHYSLPFLDQIIGPMAASSILMYAMYTLDESTIAKHGPHLSLTVPFVVFGVLRYLWLVHERQEGGNPSRLLFTDKHLVLSGVLWAAVVFAILTWGAAPQAI